MKVKDENFTWRRDATFAGAACVPTHFLNTTLFLFLLAGNRVREVALLYLLLFVAEGGTIGFWERPGVTYH